MFDQSEVYFEERNSMQKFTTKTFMWMALGLFITAISAFLTLSTGFIYVVYANMFMPLVLLFAQFGVVIALSARLYKIKPSNAVVLFIFYSVLTGITFSTLAAVYTLTNLAYAFLVTVVYFASLAFIGVTTKMNLLRFGPILFASLLALVVCEVIMMLMGMNINTMLFAGIGLLIFTGLTVYDAQKMKVVYHEYQHDEEMLQRLAIYSAFELYLDFINIFLYILRILGNRD